MKKKSLAQPRWVWMLMSSLFIVALLFFIPLPFFVMQPGSVFEVQPMVNIKGREGKKEGSFYMTTVSMRKGNVINWVAAQFHEEYDLIPQKEVVGEDGDPNRYEQQQREIMEQSQQEAILAAYREAQFPVKESFQGVKVMTVLDHLPAEKALQVGDIITGVHGKSVKREEDLMKILSHKQPGDLITVTFSRQGDHCQENIRLVSLPGQGKERAGLGIHPLTMRQIESEPSVTIHADGIGGPSAGLMFSLEILSQLRKQDLTKGYQIAGTGTISPRGEVGQIGGIKHKIRAAKEKNVDIFFVPKDQSEQDHNEEEAQAVMEGLDTTMKVVPVKSLQEAIHYLEGLSTLLMLPLAS